MIYLIVEKSTDEIKMVCNEQISVDSEKFNIVEYDDNWDDYKNGGYKGVGYKMWYKNNSIIKEPLN